MTVRGEVLALILLCALVTVIPRVLPFLAAHRMRLSPRAVAWFRFLPPAILASLLAPSLLMPGGEWLKTVWSPEIPAACLAAAVSLKTRSIVAALAAGMLGYAALSALFA